jgi:hypothetical protein
VEQVNKHLNNIALKHAAHDPSKASHFIKEGGRGQGASAVLLLIVMKYYVTRCNQCKFSGFHGRVYAD